MRSISQIYSEAVSTRNNYLQLTELNSGRSNSKLSIINLLTYVVAVCIHTYESILDVFQVRIAEVLHGRINGTPDWYAMVSKKFQYNAAIGAGDELVFNEDTMKIEYVKVDQSHRIIKQAAWQTDKNTNVLTLKVCKDNTNTNEVDNGTPYMQLNDNELTAFKTFIRQIKFVGAEIECKSLPGDIIKIKADSLNPVFYDDRYVTKSQALKNIQKAMIKYSNEMKFNEVIYYQSIIDVIRKAEHITDVGNGIKVFISSFNETTKQYDPETEIKTRTYFRSGFMRLLDSNSIMTINEANITLIPASRMDEFTTSKL